MLLVSGIRLPYREPEGEAVRRAAKLAGLPPSAQARGAVVRRAVDARHKEKIQFVYTVGFDTPQAARLVARAHSPAVTLRDAPRLDPRPGTEALISRPVIAGFGPAGMFCALLLAQYGYRPLVLERGGSVDERVEAVGRFLSGGALCEDTNVQFGEGGAGTFSDGKLTTRIGDARGAWVLRQLARFGAPPEILRQAKPHIGTDLLRDVVKRLRREIAALGGEVRFHTALRDLTVRDGTVRAAVTDAGEIETQALVAALGHSARDSFAMLARRGLAMEPKAFSVGVRVEHLRADVERALYGACAGDPLLPPAEYQLSHREGGRGVYTFCMCPGGVVIPAASSPGELVVNGMSEHARDGRNSCSALVVGVEPEDFLSLGDGALAGVRFQRELERRAFALGGNDFTAPAQTAGRFLAGAAGADFGRVEPTYARGVAPADFSALFPPFVLELLRTGLRRFGARQQGFDAADAVLTGVESRTSSPVRIRRGDDGQASLQGLYPCGEGAGYAGGIVSAAVDGVRAAIHLIERYRPMEPVISGAEAE